MLNFLATVAFDDGNDDDILMLLNFKDVLCSREPDTWFNTCQSYFQKIYQNHLTASQKNWKPKPKVLGQKLEVGA